MNRSHRLTALTLFAFLTIPLVAQSADHFGSLTPAKNADRTVVLQPDTKYVNVERGEIITLVYKDKSFTWKFDTFGLPTIRLSEIAPGDFGAEQVRIAVFPHRIFDAGG